MQQLYALFIFICYPEQHYKRKDGVLRKREFILTPPTKKICLPPQTQYIVAVCILREMMIPNTIKSSFKFAAKIHQNQLKLVLMMQGKSLYTIY